MKQPTKISPLQSRGAELNPCLSASSVSRLDPSSASLTRVTTRCSAPAACTAMNMNVARASTGPEREGAV